MLVRTQVPATTAPGPPVEYVTAGSVYNSAMYIADELLEGLRCHEYEPEDIFVLAASVKAKQSSGGPSPMQVLENELVHAGVPVYVSNSDVVRSCIGAQLWVRGRTGLTMYTDTSRKLNTALHSSRRLNPNPAPQDSVSDDLVRGKSVFTTFHSGKGLERKVVVIFGFSQEHFKFFQRDHPQWVCPNTMYVAATRASQRLYVVAEDTEGAHLPFLRRETVDAQVR